jgi:hypothetical protein
MTESHGQARDFEILNAASALSKAAKLHASTQHSHEAEH